MQPPCRQHESTYAARHSTAVNKTQSVSLNLGRRLSTAEANLWSLVAVVGSLGCSLMPPGDSVKRRVNGEQQETCNPKLWRKKNALIHFLRSVAIQNKVIIHPLSSKYSRLSIYTSIGIVFGGAEPWKHLQSYKTKLVSAMLNFHAKTEDIGSKHTVPRHSFN